MASEEAKVLPPGNKASFHHCDSAEDLHSSHNNSKNTLITLDPYSGVNCLLGTMPGSLYALFYVITLANYCPHCTNEEIEARGTG